VSAIDALVKLRTDLQGLARAVKRETAKSVARQSMRAEALRLGQSWFSEVRPAIFLAVSDFGGIPRARQV